MWALKSNGDLQEGNLCGPSSLLWQTIHFPCLCLLVLGGSLGLRTIDPYSPNVVNRNCSRLQKQGSVFSKRCNSNPKQQVLCAHDKERFCCFGYVSFLLTFHSFILIIVSLLASFLHLCSKTWHEKM